MSLKAFHVVFITAACALAFGCAVWGFKNFFSPEGRPLDLAFGIGSFIAGVALIVYERYFLKKLKDVSYL
jgi:peptidoglycan biosynthesis protein MviN/MurJ (putative lipid II flippase)